MMQVTPTLAAQPIGVVPSSPAAAASRFESLPWMQRLAMLTSPAAVVPADESQRLSELREFAILDTEPEEAFDRLVELAATLCGVPMAALSFVDADRHWYKSRAIRACAAKPSWAPGRCWK
jgi:hypothetical protein